MATVVALQSSASAAPAHARRKQSASSLRSQRLRGGDDDLMILSTMTTTAGASATAERRYVEDDMEDLISIPVSRALTPKRSRTHIVTYLPTSSSTSSLSSLPDLLPTPSRNAKGPSSGGSRSRSTSPETDRGIASQQPGPRPRHPLTTDHEHDNEKPLAATVPKASTSSRPATTPALAARNTNATVKTKQFHTNNPPPPSVTKAAPTRTPSTRRRAQTAALKPRLSPQKQTLSSSLPSSSASRPTHPKPQPQKRRRTYSTNSRDRTTDLSSRRDADEDFGPLPPWAHAAPPTLYRSDDGTIEHTGRADDVVLPAVARKLEAERLEREALDGRAAGLIDAWGPDGLPRSMTVVSVRREAAGEDVREGKEEKEVRESRMPTPPPKVEQPVVQQDARLAVVQPPRDPPPPLKKEEEKKKEERDKDVEADDAGCRCCLVM